MGATNRIKILESFQGGPPPGSVADLSIPLTCCDMSWIGFPPVQRLIFYQHPFSNRIFLDDIIPGLKNSLSSALEHFPSLAGNLIIFSDSTKPEIRYVEGNSVTVLFTESSFPDFEYLLSDQPRNCSEFYPLVPQLSESTKSGGLEMTPLAAFQVTLFPGKGMCIGISYQHVAGDGASMVSFVKAWSQICKSGEEEAEKGNLLSPIYDREVMKVHTKELDDDFWNNLRNIKPKDDEAVPLQVQISPEDSDKVRTTFVISLEEILRLKKHVSDKKTTIQRLSKFTVVCGYVWACMTKPGVVVVDNNDKNGKSDEHYFLFGADGRGRIDPLVPANYFGNCLIPITVIAKEMELFGDEGFVTATEIIGDTLQKKLTQDGGVLQVFRTFWMDMAKVKDWTKLLSVAGSPLQNYYNMDFGWGKARKVEVTSIYSSTAISISGCRDESGGVEIGLVLPKKRMDVFTEIFREGLEALTE